jgi:hypothetical protein
MNEKDEESDIPFALDIITYPFHQSGYPLFFVGAILICLSSLAIYAPVIGGFASLFIFAYLSGLFFELVNLSATDQEELYSFPDLSDPWEDIALPAIKVIGVVAISFLPIIAWSFWGDPESTNADAISYASIAVAAIYFPMAMLGTVIFGSLIGAMPHIVFPAIFRAGGLYLVAVLLVFGLFCFGPLSLYFLPGGVTGYILAALIAMFVLMTIARTLGLLYLRREDQLGWVYQRETETIFDVEDDE